MINKHKVSDSLYSSQASLENSRSQDSRKCYDFFLQSTTDGLRTGFFTHIQNN